MPAGITNTRTHEQPADVEVRDAGPADREDIREVVEAAYAQFKTSKGGSADLRRLRGARVFAFHTATFMTEAIALYERLGYCRIPHFDLDVTNHLGFPDSKPIMVIAFRRNLRDDGPCAGGVTANHRNIAFAHRSRRPR